MWAAGVALALGTILYGFALGGLFGGFESDIKKHFRDGARSAPMEVYAGDTRAMNRVARRCWSYLRRAHEHANGIGTAALAMLLLLGFLEYNRLARGLVSLALGVGGLGYSSFWMFAAFRAPALGGTGIARESLAWLAIPSAFLCIAGTAGVLLIFIHAFLRSKL